MIVRIKNAYRAKKESVLIPHSNLKEALAKVLKGRGYIGDIERKGRKIRKFLEISLKYDDGAPALTGARRVSKPSRRMYVKSADLKPVKYGHGIAVISTSQGLMANKEAKEKKSQAEPPPQKPKSWENPALTTLKNWSRPGLVFLVFFIGVIFIMAESTFGLGQNDSFLT